MGKRLQQIRKEKEAKRAEAESKEGTLRHHTLLEEIKQECAAQNYETFEQVLEKFKEFKELTDLQISYSTKEIAKNLKINLSAAQDAIVSGCPEDYTFENIINLPQILGIDLETFRCTVTALLSSKIIEVELNATSLAVHSMHKLWSNGQQANSLKLLKHFVNKGVKINAAHQGNHILTRAVELFPKDLKFIAMIAESPLVEINVVFTHSKDEARKAIGACVTPFTYVARNVATTKGVVELNENLIKIFLENGADPFLADKENRSITENSNRVCCSDYLSPTDLIEYFKKLDSILIEFQLAKLKRATLSSPDSVKIDIDEDITDETTQAAEQTKATTKSKKSKHHKKLKPKHKKVKKEEADDASDDTGPEVEETDVAIKVVESSEAILNQFAELKEDFSRVEALPPETREKYQLEALFLRYILTSEDTTKQQINSLLANSTPQDRTFYEKILSDIAGSDEHAAEVFTSSSSTKNYFVLVQKLFAPSQDQTPRLLEIEEPAQELVLAAGIHPLPGSPNIFMELSPDFIDSLPQVLQRKLSAHLTDLSRISSSSENQTGVKLYTQNIAKIKFAGSNDGIFSTHCIKGTCEGKKVMILQFNEVANHNVQERLLKEGGSYEEAGDITHLIYAPPSIVDSHMDLNTPTEGQDGIQDMVAMAGLPSSDAE